MTSRQNIKLSAAQRLVMQPLTDAAMREALDEFELVCENNDVRKLTDAEKYAAQEFALSLVHGDPSGAPVTEAEPTDKLAPTLILTGAQLLEALDLIAPDRAADQLESEVSFQYSNGHDGEGMYCWVTEYPEEGATKLDSSIAQPEQCEHDYVQSDRVCIECGETPATADERAAFEACWLRDVPEEHRGFAKTLLDGYSDDYKEAPAVAAAWKMWQAARASQAAAPAEAREPHADDVAVDEFAIEMKAKMAAARAKGRSGWETCAPADLSRMLREHVEKGDPRDVANFSMMLYHHGAPISAPADAGRAAARAYPDALTEDLRHVLGFPNFRCGPYAHLMRAAGANIQRKSEDEQAHVLHWLVKLVIDHGERWADVAQEELDAMREKVAGHQGAQGGKGGEA
ncbi:hypothetical protein [Burkholderia gladioli]|uniref:hypothetical protein n=1 Tax=Burkholderia gladioli TaxID=28095 RepID=UPI001FC8AB78|nr:hypothetical protein [Burkholderia gladioli]